jgi:hypothetical protein
LPKSKLLELSLPQLKELKLRNQFLLDIKNREPYISFHTILSYIACIIDSKGIDTPIETLEFLSYHFAYMDSTTEFSDRDLDLLRLAADQIKKSHHIGMPKEDTIDSNIIKGISLERYTPIFTLVLPFLINPILINRLKEGGLDLPFDSVIKVPVSYNTGWFAMCLYIYGSFSTMRGSSNAVKATMDDTSFYTFIEITCKYSHPSWKVAARSLKGYDYLRLTGQNHSSLKRLFINKNLLFELIPYLTTFNINFKEDSKFNIWYDKTIEYLKRF